MDLLRNYGYVKASSYRVKVLEVLKQSKVLTPTEIAKATGIRTNHISKVLSELKGKGLIVCINEEAKKGRLYNITKLGEAVYDFNGGL